MAHTTPVSLLKELCQPQERAQWQQAWTRFVDLYTPLLFDWAQRVTQQPNEAEEVVQEVFINLTSKISAYERERGPFRRWLRTVTVNAWRKLKRQTARAAKPLAEDAVPDDAEQFWEGEHRAYLARRALQLARKDFPDTWEPCWEILVAGRPAAEVARQFGTTESALRMAKYRILKRLRQELEGLE